MVDFKNGCFEKRTKLHQPRLWFITGGYLVKRWFITAAARARAQSNDLNREILASNLFNCHKEVINAPPVPSISRCIHIVYRHKNVWEYQWSNFIYNCMSTFLHYVHCKDALLDCSGDRCESLTWVDEIDLSFKLRVSPVVTWTQCLNGDMGGERGRWMILQLVETVYLYIISWFVCRDGICAYTF